MQIQSEEPWIPWELCKLYGTEYGKVVEGPFFCEAFALARWLPGLAMKPYLQLNNMAVVVPADSGLAFAARERDYLLSLANGGRNVKRTPATFLEVREALASGVYDGWHFSGHGGFRGSDPHRSTIYLENQETLTPEDLSGRVSNLGIAKPVVFFNACQIGRSTMSLTDIGGWARQFLRTGAGAFSGAYWSIYDQPAYDFAKELFSRVLSLDKNVYGCSGFLGTPIHTNLRFEDEIRTINAAKELGIVDTSPVVIAVSTMLAVMMRFRPSILNIHSGSVL